MWEVFPDLFAGQTSAHLGLLGQELAAVMMVSLPLDLVALLRSQQLMEVEKTLHRPPKKWRSCSCPESCTDEAQEPGSEFEPAGHAASSLQGCSLGCTPLCDYQRSPVWKFMRDRSRDGGQGSWGGPFNPRDWGSSVWAAREARKNVRLAARFILNPAGGEWPKTRLPRRESVGVCWGWPVWSPIVWIIGITRIAAATARRVVGIGPRNRPWVAGQRSLRIAAWLRL